MCRQIEAAFEGRSDVRLTRIDDIAEWPPPVIGIYPVGNRWPVREVQQALIDGDPAIHLDPLRDRIQINVQSSHRRARRLSSVDRFPPLVLPFVLTLSAQSELRSARVS